MHLPVREIVGVQFALMSEAEERSRAAAIVDQNRLINGLAESGTLYDSRLGVNDDSVPCGTCQQRQELCPKHHGIIELSARIIDPSKPCMNELQKWLRVVCFRCGALTFDPHAIANWSKVPKRARLTVAADYCKVVRMSDRRAKDGVIIDKAIADGKYPKHCGALHPLILVRTVKQQLANGRERAANKAEFLMYLAERPRNAVNEMILTPDVMYHIMAKVTPETVSELGFNPAVFHPTVYLRKQVHVLPSHLRNSQLVSATGKPTADNITQNLSHLIKINDRMRNDVPALDLETMLNPHADKAPFGALTLQMYLRDLYIITDCVNAIVNGKVFQDNRSIGPTDHSIRALLNSKRGLIRQDGLGARMHNRARCVITNDRRLRLDEVRLPVFFAMRLYRKEVVTRNNYTTMRKLLANGTKVYPGCFEVQRRDGSRYMVDRISPDTFDLRLGDTLTRHIQEGDWIELNRQPSTLMSNMNMHKVRINPDPKAFAIGINIEACDLYNADFDGDQMTILIHADMGSVVECKVLSSVKRQFISDQTSTPRFGLSQDSRTLAAEMTRTSVRLTRSEAMYIFEHVDGVYVFADKPEFTGREVMSMILPPIDYRRANNFAKSPLSKWLDVAPDEYEVVIKQGQIVSGVFDGSIVAPNKGSIFDKIFMVYGVDRAMETIYNMQQLVLDFGRIYTFTISVRDFYIFDNAARADIYNSVSKLLESTKPIITAYQSGRITAPADQTVQEHYEAKITEMLAVEPTEPIVRALGGASSLVKMIMYGSRGSVMNLINICGAVGQVLIDGKRPIQNFDYNRSSVFTRRNDESPTARGYIPVGYSNGLPPDGYYQRSKETRAAITKKALQTAVAGAMCRVMVRNCESLVCNWQFAIVRNVHVVSWRFGDDGYEPSRVYELRIPGLIDSDAAFNERYAYRGGQGSASAAVKRALAQLQTDRIRYRESFLQVERMSGKPTFTDMQRMPLDLETLVEQVLAQRAGDTESTLSAHVDMMIEMVERFCEQLPRMILPAHMEARSIPTHFRNTNIYLQMYIRSCLHASVLVRLTVPQLTLILERIRSAHLHALMQPGCAGGIKVATGTSEPTTQSQLDAQHMTGADRFTKYAIGAIKAHLNAKDTSLTGEAQSWMRVRPEFEKDKVAVENIARKIQLILLDEFVDDEAIFYESYGEPTHPSYAGEKAIYTTYAKYRTNKVPALGNYCLRIKLNRIRLLIKNIELIDIVSSIQQEFPALHIVYTLENAVDQPMVLRIHPTQVGMKKIKGLPGLRDLLTAILSTRISGVPGIKEAFTMESTVNRIDETGAIKIDTIFLIRTRGTNMIGLLAVPEIDPASIESTSMVESWRLFGLSFARAKIIQEWSKILSKIAPCHFVMHADTMTSMGKITSLARKGVLSREPNNVLLSASVGFASLSLRSAAINNVRNPIYGLSAPLLLGQSIKIGTGAVETCLDPAFLTERAKSAPRQELVDML